MNQRPPVFGAASSRVVPTGLRTKYLAAAVVMIIGMINNAIHDY